MFVSHARDKELNAIVYFVENTRYANTLKVFKLLNFLDFEHYRQTGRGVTGLHYLAFPQGPVPEELWNEIRNPQPDLRATVDVQVKKDELTDEVARRDFVVKKKFDPRFFTRRELKILETLAFFFKELTATQMSKYSHSKDMPWKKVYQGEGKPAARIPYQLTLESGKIIPDMPNIDSDELEYRNEALKEVRAATR